LVIGLPIPFAAAKSPSSSIPAPASTPPLISPFLCNEEL